MNGKPAKALSLPPLVLGVGALGLAALYATRALQELPRVTQDMMALPLGQLFHDSPNIMQTFAYLVIGVGWIWLGFRSRASIAPADSPMAEVRQTIDDLDGQLVMLLAQRQRQIEAAVEVKRNNAIPARVPERVDEVLRHVATCAERENLDGGLAKSLWTTLIEWSIAYEERLMKNPGEEREPR